MYILLIYQWVSTFIIFYLRSKPFKDFYPEKNEKNEIYIYIRKEKFEKILI